MKDVYVVVSILNGYKNIEGVFERNEDAENFVTQMKGKWGYEKHEFYVCKYPLI